MLTPIYTVETCQHPAYQLDWSYTLFWHFEPPEPTWLPALQQINEPDGIRLLSHHLADSKTSQFLISTQPHVSPQAIAKCVKGRLQALLRREYPYAFQRNYALRSIGSADRITIDAYVARQLAHHPPADPRVTAQFEQFQFQNSSIDLSKPSRTTHAIYWYNLHLVFVNDQRYRDIAPERVQARCRMIQAVANKKSHGLARYGVLPDYLHLILRGNL